MSNTLPSIISINQKEQATSTKDLGTNLTYNLPVASSGSLEEYINFVNSVPLLTEAEEYSLALKWHQYEDVEAARYLVLSHLRLVVSVARGYMGYGLAFADIIQEGTIGLMKAIKRFDPKRKVRLVTFAVHWIRAEINEYVIKNWRIVKTVTTKTQRKLFFNLRSKRSDSDNLSEEEAKEIANSLNVSRDDVVDMNMRLSGTDVALIGETDEEFAPANWLTDTRLNPEYLVEQKRTFGLHTEGIEAALAKLDERSRDIITSRWLQDEGATLIELAQKYHISAERVRQIEVKAMEKMKLALEKHQN